MAFKKNLNLLFTYFTQLFKEYQTITRPIVQSPRAQIWIDIGILLHRTKNTQEFRDLLIGTDVLHLSKNGIVMLEFKIISPLLFKVNGFSWGFLTASGVSHHRFWITVHKLLWLLSHGGWELFGKHKVMSCASKGQRLKLFNFMTVAIFIYLFASSFEAETEQWRMLSSYL